MLAKIFTIIWILCILVKLIKDWRLEHSKNKSNLEENSTTNIKPTRIFRKKKKNVDIQKEMELTNKVLAQME